jgi:hypothetical protein
MTLMLLMNLGFAGGSSGAPTFKVAWAQGANVVLQPGRSC